MASTNLFLRLSPLLHSLITIVDVVGVEDDFDLRQEAASHDYGSAVWVVVYVDVSVSSSIFNSTYGLGYFRRTNLISRYFMWPVVTRKVVSGEFPILRPSFLNVFIIALYHRMYRLKNF